MDEADRALGDSLDALAEALAGMDEESADKAAPICDALQAIDTEGEDDQRFVKALVGLARAVIDVRGQCASDPVLSQLPVPPYDLWLPFKAGGNTPPPDTAAAMAIWNTKVGEETPERPAKENPDAEKSVQ